MSYDFEGGGLSPPVMPSGPPPDPKDLEVLVTLLELAAIDLTPAPDVRFTSDQLVAKAMDWGGREMGVEEADLRIVIRSSSFLRRHPRGELSLR